MPSPHRKTLPGQLWGGQSWPQPPFRRLDPLESGSAGKIARPTICAKVRSWENDGHLPIVTGCPHKEHHALAA